MMAIVAVMMVVGFSAFKVVDTMNDNSDIDWYEVGPRVDEEDVLEIKGLYPGVPFNGTDPVECATDNDGTICALELEVGPMAPNLIGVDISTLSNLQDVDEKDSAAHP